MWITLHREIESSKFVSQRARTLGEFDSRKDSHQPNWNEGLSFLNLRFRELFGSMLAGLHPFDNIAIIHRVKNRLKTER